MFQTLVSLFLMGTAQANEGIEGSGVQIVDARTVTTFDQVTVRSSADVEVRVGPMASVTVFADDNIAALLRTEVEDGELTIDADYGWATLAKVRIVVTTPTLSAIALRGSGQVDVTGVRASTFEATQEGSGDLSIAGTTKALAVTAAGSGKTDLTDLSAARTKATSRGSGILRVNGGEQLSAVVKGSGSIVYTGTPTLSVETSGTGGVRPRI